jgi:hypothetical protein
MLGGGFGAGEELKERGLAMSVRRLRVAAVSIALLLFAAWLAMPVDLHPDTSITRDVFRRIKKGMTAEDVTGILGPPRHHVAVHGIDHETAAEWFGTLDPEVARCNMRWRTDTAEVVVGLDTSGRVVAGYFEPREVLPETNFSRLYKWCMRKIYEIAPLQYRSESGVGHAEA